jgi:succinoglycan biosynthesis transport protein ExoP
MLWIGALTLAAVVLAGTVLYYLPSHFESQVALLVTQQRASGPTDGNSQQPSTQDLSDQSIASQVDAIRAAPIVRDVISELHLDADPEFNPNADANPRRRVIFVSELEDALGAVIGVISEYFHPTVGDRNDLKILYNVTRAIDVSVKVSSHTIVITATSKDPDKSTAMANALASSYLKHRLEVEKARSKRVDAWLGERLTELRQGVRQHEDEVERMRAQIGQYQGQTSSILSEKLTQISRELLDTNAKLADAEAKRGELNMLTSDTTNSSADDVQNSLLIQTLRRQESQILVQRAAAQSQYGERNPALIALNEQVAEVRRKIATEITRIDEKVSDQIRVLNGKAAALDVAQRGLQDRIETQNAALVRLRAIQSDADTDRATYQAFAIYRSKMIDAPTIAQSDVQVISPATPALTPISPNRKAILAFVGFATLTLGVVVSVLRAGFAQDLRSAEQASALLGLRTLALIPKARGRKPIDRTLVDFPASALAESIRYLYSTIANKPPPRHGALRVLVSSALPGEGKTTTSRLLAREAALVGVNTLLLNLDLRGYSGPNEVDASFNVEITTEKATGLRILNVRSCKGKTFAILHHPAFWAQMEELSARHELMIVDSPPVLSVSDAAAIARFTDLTMFVVKWGKTKVPAVAEALRQLRFANNNILGLVLTQVDVRKHAMYGFGDSGIYTGSHKKYYIEG